MMNYSKNIVKWLPYIYFFVFLLLVSNPENRLYTLIFSIPFLLQLFFQLRYLDQILGALTFILSLWLMLAYVSDLNKIMVITSQSRKFIAFGGTLVCSNFVMSILLFRNALNRLNKPVALREINQEGLI